jgi:hypothetical protein
MFKFAGRILVDSLKSISYPGLMISIVRFALGGNFPGFLGWVIVFVRTGGMMHAVNKGGKHSLP